MTAAFSRLVVILLLQILLSGCEKPPTDAVIKAERLTQEAKKAEAEVYAKGIFAKTEKTLKKTKEHIAVKEYKKAKESAMEASQLAQESIMIAKAEKVRLKEDAELMEQEIEGLLGELQTYNEKRSGKPSKGKTRGLQSMLSQFQSDLSSARGKLQTQEIMQAHSQLKLLRDNIVLFKESMSHKRGKTKR